MALVTASGPSDHVASRVTAFQWVWPLAAAIKKSWSPELPLSGCSIFAPVVA
jgi:hypothetical protein